MRVPESVGARVLAELGAPPHRVVDTVRAALSEGAADLPGAETFASGWHEMTTTVNEASYLPRRGLRARPTLLVAAGACLLALAFGLGVLAGWLIWA